jgi:hypothetical protein
MLSELEQREVWDAWLSAEIRADYFADLALAFDRRQAMTTWVALLASSGAIVTSVTQLFPEAKWAPAVLAAAASFYSLTAQNHKKATDCRDLHLRWNNLAAGYRALWDDVYAEDAAQQLAGLRARRADASRASSSLPYQPKRMLRWQRLVEEQHAYLQAHA